MITLLRLNWVLSQKLKALIDNSLYDNYQSNSLFAIKHKGLNNSL